MPIKDVIVPGFIGTDTIEFIVTRGMGAAATTSHVYSDPNILVGDMHGDEMYRKGVAITGYTFALVNKTDGSAITSGTVTTKVTKDGGTQAGSTNAAAHEGNGQWSINITSTEMDADVVGIVFTHTDAVPEFITIRTR